MSLFPGGSRLLKVSIGEDKRRLQVSAPEGSPAVQQLAAIRAAVREGFGVPQAADLQLRYADDEGDMCTLTEDTLPDLASLSPAGTLHLSAQPRPAGAAQPQPQGAPQPGAAAAGASAAGAAGPGAGAGRAAAGAEATAGFPGPGGQGGVPLPFLPFLGPLLAGMQGGGGGGLPFLPQGGGGGLPFLPQGGGLPSLPQGGGLPFLPQGGGGGGGGLDGDAAAGLIVPLLPMLAGMAEGRRADLSQAGVQHREALLPLCRAVQGRLPAFPEAQPLGPALQAYIDGSDTQHLGDVAVPFLQALAASPDQAAVKATVAALFAEGMRAAPLFQAQAQGAPWMQCLGGKGLGKGRGKGKDAMVQGLLQGLLATQAAQAGAAPPPAPPAQGGASTEEQAQDLVSMGLAADVAAARRLLAAHGGNVAAVVAAVCED